MIPVCVIQQASSPITAESLQKANVSSFQEGLLSCNSSSKLSVRSGIRAIIIYRFGIPDLQTILQYRFQCQVPFFSPEFGLPEANQILIDLHLSTQYVSAVI